jgi:uncharacterized membrane protein
LIINNLEIYLKICKNRGLPFLQSRINLHNHLKTKVMKLVKLSVFALTMGLFVASCGSSSNEAATETPATTEAPAAEAAPAPAPEAAPATTDSAAAATPAAAPAAAPATK